MLPTRRITPYVTRCLWRRVLLGSVILWAGSLASAGAADLDLLLSDAQYALNRYQELSDGLDCTELPSKRLQTLCKQEKHTISGNVEQTKAAVLRASRSKNPRNIDLLDIYSELEEIGGSLAEMSDNATTFTKQDPTPFAEASSKTLVLAAKLYSELRKRIGASESDCRS